MNEWPSNFEQEVAGAESALRQGFEGRSRVQLRRAAGAVIREYFRQHGMQTTRTSAYDLLRELCGMEGFHKDVYSILDHFLLRVDEDHHLPEDINLFSDIYRLKDFLISG